MHDSLEDGAIVPKTLIWGFSLRQLAADIKPFQHVAHWEVRSKGRWAKPTSSNPVWAQRCISDESSNR
jgi:hypothetical protein